MAIELIDKIKPKNGGSFPMVDAADVQMGDGNRLSAFAEGVASKEYVHDYVQGFVPDAPEGAATEEYVQQYVNDFASDFLDTTLTASGKAAESAAVGQYFTQAMMTFGEELANKQPKGNYVQTINGQTPDADGNVVVEVGGGVTSWNDLTDKPFYEEAGTETVFAPQDVTFAASGQGWIAETMANIPIVPSNSYLVTWGDDEYNLTAGAFSMQGMDVPYLGNLANIQMGADTGEPFVVMYMEMPNGDEIIRGLLIGGSTAEFGTDPSVTPTKNVAVYYDTTIVKTLDAKFLPMEAIDARIELYIAEALGGDY